MRPTACYEVVYHARQSSLARQKFGVGLGKGLPKLWRAREGRLALTSYQGDEGCIKQPKVVHHFRQLNEPLGDTVFKVHLLRKVHLGGDSGEDETLLSSVWHGELNLPVQSSRTEEGRV